MTDDVRVALVNQAFVPPGMVIGETGAHLPSLGLLMLASAIEEADAGMKGRVAYFDEEHLGIDGCKKAVIDWLSSAKTGLVMLTTYTMTHHRQEMFIRTMQAHGFLCLAGGPHVTMHPHESSADAVVLGEGVSAMRSLFPWPGFLPRGVPGMRYKEVDCLGNVSWTGAERPLRQLLPSMWPSPSFAYHLVPSGIVHRASRKRDLGGRAPMSIVLSKGCPSACHFCTSGAQNGPWAVGHVERFRVDLEHLLKHTKAEAIEFHDDDLFSHPDVEEVFDVMKNTGLPWTCYTRANPLQGESGRRLARLAHEAGCKRVFLGLESMNNNRLETLGKKANENMNREAVLNLHHADVEVSAAWIIGLPEDTPDILEEELATFLGLPLYCLDVNILNINPGSVFSKKVITGRMQPSCGSDIERAEDLLPDPERYGEQEPWGQPTLCAHMSKSELNTFAEHARRRIERELLPMNTKLRHHKGVPFEDFRDALLEEISERR